MDNLNISVIIPIYNAENTLARSIQSVLKQTILDIEIICIDDGSSDSSAELIKALQKQHPRIVLLKQNHKGAGPARNMGMKAARGKYISFLDADDEFADVNALETMVQACIKYQAYICGSNRIEILENIEQDAGLFVNHKIPENGCFIDYDDFQYDYDYQSFIFDRNFLIKNDIWFPPYMRYQDPPFFVKAMSVAGRFYAVPVTLYRYTAEPARQSIVVEKHIYHILQGIKDTLEIAMEKGYHQLFENAVQRVDNAGGGFHNAVLQNLSDEVMVLLFSINEMSKQFQDKGLEILPEIYMGMQRMDRLLRSHDLMRKILIINRQDGGFRPYFEARGIKCVAVYGLGEFGKILVNELEICGIDIVCGIDRMVTAYGEIPVIQPEEPVPECDALIVSLMEPEDVMRYYEAMGKKNVYAFAQIIQDMADTYQVV